MIDVRALKALTPGIFELGLASLVPETPDARTSLGRRRLQDKCPPPHHKLSGAFVVRSDPLSCFLRFHLFLGDFFTM